MLPVTPPRSTEASRVRPPASSAGLPLVVASSTYPAAPAAALGRVPRAHVDHHATNLYLEVDPFDHRRPVGTEHLAPHIYTKQPILLVIVSDPWNSQKLDRSWRSCSQRQVRTPTDVSGEPLNPSHAKGMDRKKRTPQNEPEFIITPDMFDFDADLTSGSRQPIIHCYELGARYLLGFRYPTSEYLQAVIDYTTRRYRHRMTGNIEAMLWELDQGTIYGDKSVISTTTITTWELTQQGSKAAVDELISSLSSGRRPNARTILMAVYAAMTRVPIELWLSNPPSAERSAVPKRAVTLQEIQDVLAQAQLAIKDQAHLGVLIPNADMRYPLKVSTQLENQGLLKRHQMTVEEQRRGVLSETQVKGLRWTINREIVHVSPLSSALLKRRLDRRPLPEGRGRRYRNSDSILAQKILCAHFANPQGFDIDAVAEQVHLEYPGAMFRPYRYLPPNPNGAMRYMEKRVDLTLWLPGDNPQVPSTILEIERAKSSTDTFERIISHLEAGVATSAGTRTRMTLFFVADARTYDKVKYAVTVFRRMFNRASRTIWTGAKLKVFLIPLKVALEHGLSSSDGCWESYFNGTGESQSTQFDSPFSIARRIV